MEQVPTLHDDAVITETEFRAWLQDVMNNGIWRPAAHTTSTAAATISFAGIPQTGSLLAIVWALDTDTTSGSANCQLTVNNDYAGGASADYTYILGSVSTVTSVEVELTNHVGGFGLPANANPAGAHGTAWLIIHGYTLPGFKTCTGISSYYAGATTTQVRVHAGTWETFAPITAIKLDSDTGSFVAGGAVSLWIAGGTTEGVQPIAAPNI